MSGWLISCAIAPPIRRARTRASDVQPPGAAPPPRPPRSSDPRCRRKFRSTGPDRRPALMRSSPIRIHRICRSGCMTRTSLDRGRPPNARRPQCRDRRFAVLGMNCRKESVSREGTSGARPNMARQCLVAHSSWLCGVYCQRPIFAAAAVNVIRSSLSSSRRSACLRRCAGSSSAPTNAVCKAMTAKHREHEVAALLPDAWRLEQHVVPGGRLLSLKFQRCIAL